MALPGLEPNNSGSDEGRLAEVAPDLTQIPDSYGGATIAATALEASLPTVNCSNVANALRELLELAKQAGIDPCHPAMKAAAAALEELATFNAWQPTGGS
jgi:hypothetical protein